MNLAKSHKPTKVDEFKPFCIEESKSDLATDEKSHDPAIIVMDSACENGA